MPADRAAALVGDAAAGEEVNAIGQAPRMLPAFTTVRVLMRRADNPVATR